VSWARLAAASGLVAVTYTNEDSATDARTVLEYVKRNAASFGVDEQKIGVWACSGNVPTALSLLMQDAETRVRCAVLAYG
jgi:carboxylesterase type B